MRLTNHYHYRTGSLLVLLAAAVSVRAFAPRSDHRPTTSSTNGPTVTTTALCAGISPLDIDELPVVLQASVFVGSYAGLGIGTVAGTRFLDDYSKKGLGLELWRKRVVDGPVVPGLLGLLYAVAGIGHFADAPGFRSIVPPPGTWGIWYVPGSAAFHVAWTGLAEIAGGSGLLWAAFRNANSSDDDEDGDEPLAAKLVQPGSAALLFGLTAVVTPANIYMFTHGATMGDYSLGLDYHVVRFGIQVVLLSLLLVLAKDSLLFAWADDLD